MTQYDNMSKAELIGELKKRERLSSSAYELVSSSDDAIIGKSLDGTISSWNRGAENIYGYSANEIIGQNIKTLSPPDRQDEVLRILEKIKRGERIKHFETVRVTKEGRQIHVSLNISPIINTAGEITGASTIARDITERKRVEKELRQSERRNAILNQIANVFLTVPDEEMYGDVLDVVVGATESKLGFFGFIAENGDLVIPSMTRGIWRECQVSDKSVVFPHGAWGDSLWGKAIREKKSFLSDGAFHTPEGHIPLHHFLTSPIVFGNKTIGLLAVANHEGGYTEEDRALLESIACNISPILNARMQRDRQEQERKRVEEALRESELRYREVFEHSSECIFLLDVTTDGRFKFAGFNPAEEKTVGYSSSEVSGKFVEEAVPAELACQIIGNYRQCLESATIINYEEALNLPVGFRYFHTVLIPVRNVVGDIYRIIGVAREITERKRMEEELRLAHEELEKRVIERTEQLEKTAKALRTSEERYALAVQGSNDGIWDLNLATGEIYFSPRWKSMLGYEDDEIPNKVEEWKKRIHPDDRHMVIETRKAYLDGRIPTYEIEYRLQHKDGSYRWIHGRGACLRDSEGKPTRFAGSHSDITDRKRIEDILRESEKKYRILFEESKDAILVSDITGRILDVNRAGMDLFGYTKEELLMLDPVRLYSNPDDRKRLWQQLYSSGFVSDYELEMKRKDDEIIIVHLTVSVLRDDEGKIFGHHGIIHDMTERKKLERQLLQAQKMESIGVLAGGVAHDFNNLLTAISGYGQILLESVPEDNELSQESIRNVMNAAERAAELTRGLLAFSRKQVISPKPVHIDTLISNTGKLIHRIIGEDIEFSTNFSDKNLLVKADPGQIEQVLMNLATNARDAMPHGGRLSVTTSQEVVKEGSEARYDLSVPGKYALISVTDTGTGIDKKSLESIFEPFYTTKEVGKGTGLGLSIVYGIIKQHNGSILVSSEPGKGTTFDMYLPLVKGHAAKEESKIFAPLVNGMETLLVVEDEEIVRMFMKKILERAGYKVIIAVNGEDAVARFREHDDISLVLSDVVMPRKNGKEMLDEIRKIKSGVKVVFISGYAADVMHKKGMFEEGTEFITKPFKKDDLLQKIREVLDKD
jgi:PAS domain S-box-containing protein